VTRLADALALFGDMEMLAPLREAREELKMLGRMFIVARDRVELFAFLKETFVEDATVAVVLAAQARAAGSRYARRRGHGPAAGKRVSRGSRRTRMRERAIWLLAILLATGCAAAAQPQASGQAYTGEIWVWDEQRNTVTLRRGSEFVRLRVTPETIRDVKLRRGETRTIRGEIDPPAPIDNTMVTTVTATRPGGTPEDIEVAGTVTAVDPAGKIRIDTSSGPVEVWITDDGPPFKVGDPARVAFRIQPLTLVIVKPGETPPPSSPPVPPVGTEPGHYAVVRGRITSVERGRVTVESPRGPIVVAVPRSESYGVDGWVDVQTSVRPAAR
jgi:hypothetical protein